MFQNDLKIHLKVTENWFGLILMKTKNCKLDAQYVSEEQVHSFIQ